MIRRSTGSLFAAAIAAAFALSPLAAGTASAATTSADSAFTGRHASHAVFVQTNNLAANTIVAYHRSDSGALTPAGTYPTGGKGGTEVNAPVDALASQGSLTYDDASGLLFAVNAGSDSVSVFAVSGDRLRLRQVISSGGDFPTSVTVNHGRVFVLNAGGSGSIVGFRLDDGRLHRIDGGWAALGLNNATTPVFITAPGQVSFSPDGRHLIVTTKANGDLDVFGVSGRGRLTSPTTTASIGPVPFSVAFDARGHVLVSEAGSASVSSYTLHWDGSLTPITSSVASGGAALCWLAGARGYVFAANTGASTLSAYATDGSGQLTLVHPVAATTDAAPIDEDATADGHLLYVQAAAAGEVQGFRVHHDGTLTLVTTVTGLPAFDGSTGMEGIVAV